VARPQRTASSSPRPPPPSQPAGDEAGVKGVAASDAADDPLERRDRKAPHAVGGTRADHLGGAVGDHGRRTRLRSERGSIQPVERQAEHRAQLLGVQEDEVRVRAQLVAAATAQLDRDAHARGTGRREALPAAGVDRRAQVQMGGGGGERRLGRAIVSTHVWSTPARSNHSRQRRPSVSSPTAPISLTPCTSGASQVAVLAAEPPSALWIASASSFSCSSG
jgi:hypothetical protein